MLPHSSQCCCGQSRNAEVKNVLKVAMDGHEISPETVLPAQLMGPFNTKKVLRAVLTTPAMVTKIHQGKTWPIHLLAIMCPQDDSSTGDSGGPEPTEVTDEGTDNPMVANASDLLLRQSSGEEEAEDQPDPHANHPHQAQLIKLMTRKVEDMVKWSLGNAMVDAKAELKSMIRGKRIRERSTSAEGKRVKLTPVKKIHFDPAYPNKKSVFPEFLTNDYTEANLDSVIHEDLVPYFVLMSVLHERQEVFCLSEGIRLHEEDSSRPIKLPIPAIFYSSDKVKLEERLNYVVETFKNRDVPNQSRKSKGTGGAGKRTQPAHTVTGPASQAQSQGDQAVTHCQPPNVTNASAQSASVTPNRDNYPCIDKRYRQPRPGVYQRPCVPERPIRTNYEGHGRANMGHNPRVVPEHLEALQKNALAKFERVRRIKDPRRMYWCFACQHEAQSLVCDACGMNNLTNANLKLRDANLALSHAQTDAQMSIGVPHQSYQKKKW